MSDQNATPNRPIVYLGPSLPLEEARVHLDADYRPPVVRGDLEELQPGCVVGIIDGEFQQSLSISPTEVRQAVERGVIIFGSSSMGALRAADVPAAHGVGRIFELYRSGAIKREDEVALTFDQDTKQPLTVPLVNIRFAVDELIKSGSIEAEIAKRIVASAEDLHFSERTHHRILKKADLGDRASRDELAALLTSFDLKGDDAIALLRRLANLDAEDPARGAGGPPKQPDNRLLGTNFDDRLDGVRLSDTREANAPFLVWEVGDQIPFAKLILFLKLTGKIMKHARRAAARFSLDGNEVEVDISVLDNRPPEFFNNFHRRRILDSWGWTDDHEADVTLEDLGFGRRDLEQRFREETIAEAKAMRLVLDGDLAFLRAVRADLLMDGLALKREVMRCGALDHLIAEAGDHKPSPDEVVATRDIICRSQGVVSWKGLTGVIAALGVPMQVINGFVVAVARARHTADRLHGAIHSPPESLPSAIYRGGSAEGGAVVLRSSPKSDHRFSMPMDQAKDVAEKLQDIIGITRVALLGELREFGVQISNVARPAGIWSSTYGSGKALSNEGAIVGGVMEETEKWANEVFSERAKPSAVASYASLCSRGEVEPVDPSKLAIPFDSLYTPDLEIEWMTGFDLLTGEPTYIPAATVHVGRQLKNDIMYSPRRGRPWRSSNGLASGFTLEEALVHAICEYVERHADKMMELRLANPGELEPSAYRFVDLETLSGKAAETAKRIQRVSSLSILHMTSEIRIPGFKACIISESTAGRVRKSMGWGVHPNPNVACEMAMCEAVQTVIGNDAGGREDLAVKARSLGRHERPIPRGAGQHWFWLRPEGPFVPVDACGGFVSNDAFDDLLWILDRLREGGVERLPMIDMTVEEARPARVVRVQIPGLEANHPFHTGQRARMVTLWDLLARLPHGVLPGAGQKHEEHHG